MNFSDLGLKPELVAAVTEKGYSPFPPHPAGGHSGGARGPRRARRRADRHRQDGRLRAAHPAEARSPQAASAPRALILTPTRELAAQVAESVRHYGKHTNLRSQVIFGGVSERPQIEAMRHGCDILGGNAGPPARPRRTRSSCRWPRWQIFVLDEADRMLDMGFIHDIKRVRALLPKERQNLLFSATYSQDIRQLAENLLRNPLSVEVAPPNSTADKVEQVSYRLPKEHKRHLLAHLINEGNWHQVLVFTRTKHGANRLAEQLARAGIPSLPIHGNKSQNARVRALEDFKSNQHHRAGGHRSRRARPRHQGTAVRRELRAAERARGLRAPHRPHRARRLHRQGHLAGVAG